LRAEDDGDGIFTAGVVPDRRMVRRYQDLICWQLADELKREVYRLLKESPSGCRDLRFADQLRAAASSGAANLSEAFGYFRHKEGARYARIAKASLTETHNHLRDGIDREHWTAERCRPVLSLTDRAIGATTRWLLYLSSSDDPPLDSQPERRASNRGTLHPAPFVSVHPAAGTQPYSRRCTWHPAPFVSVHPARGPQPPAPSPQHPAPSTRPC
jgi:four helix bundle protein